LSDLIPPNTAARIAEVLAEGDGVWLSCSGCLELEDGQNVHGYPFSKAFGCELGGGCGECGGLGARWDTTDYDAMARDIMAASEPPTVAELAERVAALERDSHPPIDLSPAIEEILTARGYGFR
jgi:hypothetical protein